MNLRRLAPFGIGAVAIFSVLGIVVAAQLGWFGSDDDLQTASTNEGLMVDVDDNGDLTSIPTTDTSPQTKANYRIDGSSGRDSSDLAFSESDADDLDGKLNGEASAEADQAVTGQATKNQVAENGDVLAVTDQVTGSAQPTTSLSTTSESSSSTSSSTVQGSTTDSKPAETSSTAKAAETTGSTSTTAQTTTTRRPTTAAPTTQTPTTRAPTTQAPTTRPPTTQAPSGGGGCGTGGEFQRTFRDDFNGSSVNQSSWNLYNSTGNAGNGLRRPEAMSVANGVLTITASNQGGQVVSGGMAHRGSQQYGKFSARVRTDVDPSRTMSGVILTWPASQVHPRDGENNMYETLPHEESATRNPFYSFIHKPYGSVHDQVRFVHRADASQWQTVTMEWTPSRVSVSVQGLGTQTVTETGADLVPDNPHIFTVQFDAFKQQIGQNLAMQVDWVEIYKYCG